MTALPRGKIAQRPFVKQLRVAGRSSEDREEWTEEVEAHRERCCDDKDETSEVQAERIRSRLAWQGRRVDITVGRVLRARGKMMKDRANGTGDCLVTEMLQDLHMEAVYEITHWFEKRFRRECRASETWKVLVFLKRPDARLEKACADSARSL